MNRFHQLPTNIDMAPQSGEVTKSVISPRFIGLFSSCKKSAIPESE